MMSRANGKVTLYGSGKMTTRAPWPCCQTLRMAAHAACVWKSSTQDTYDDQKQQKHFTKKSLNAVLIFITHKNTEREKIAATALSKGSIRLIQSII